MSHIYPDDNAQNTSSRRERKKHLGRGACTLAVAGALVLPLTPAGALADSGSSTPGTTDPTPQVVAGEEEQVSAQLTVETPDEVNPYYGKTLKIKGTGFTGIGPDQQVSLKVAPAETPANPTHFTTTHGPYNLGYVNVPASQIHDGTFEIYLNTEPLALNDYHPELNYVLSSTVTYTTPDVLGYKLAPTTAYNTQTPVFVARQNSQLKLTNTPNALVEDSLKVRGSGYNPQFIPQGGYLQVSLIEGDWPASQMVSPEHTISSVKVPAEQLAESGLFEASLPYPAGIDARKHYRVGTQIVNPDGTLANNALTEYEDVTFLVEGDIPRLTLNVPAVDPNVDSTVTVTGVNYYGSAHADAQGQSMNLSIREIDPKTGESLGTVLDHPVDYTYLVADQGIYDGFTDGKFETTFTIPKNTLREGHSYELVTSVPGQNPQDKPVFEAHQALPLTPTEQKQPEPNPNQPVPDPVPEPGVGTDENPVPEPNTPDPSIPGPVQTPDPEQVPTPGVSEETPDPQPAPSTPAPEPEVSFKDVRDRTSHYTSIRWLAQHNLLESSDGYYRPYDAVTREEAIVALYRMAGSPQVTLPQNSPYVDVAPDHPHYREIIWARERGISFGWSDGHFHPKATASHSTMAAFLYRYAGSPSVGMPQSSAYVDMEANSPFYRESVWLKNQGIVFWADSWFRPQDSVSRADFAEFLYRFEGL